MKSKNKNKVYVVWGGRYEDVYIESIFTNEADADAYVNEWNSKKPDYEDGFYILDYDVNDKVGYVAKQQFQVSYYFEDNIKEYNSSDEEIEMVPVDKLYHAILDPNYAIHITSYVDKEHADEILKLARQKVLENDLEFFNQIM